MASEENKIPTAKRRHHHKIPEGIKRQHILDALKKIDIIGWEKKNNSIKYDLLYEGNRYPPKIVVKYAHEQAFGSVLDVSEFSGGEDSTNRFFRANEFVIVLKDTDEAAIDPIRVLISPDRKISYIEELHPVLRPNVRNLEQRIFLGRKTDHVVEHEQRTALGEAGELAVIEIEKAILCDAGKESLIDQIEHMAKTQGDGLGFDIRSVTPDGGEKLIEVKTTSDNIFTPFILTDTELARSRQDAHRFCLYRLYDYDPKKAQVKYYILRGDLTSQTSIIPIQYRCIPTGRHTVETDGCR